MSRVAWPLVAEAEEGVDMLAWRWLGNLCAMFDASSKCTIVFPEECLGYGLASCTVPRLQVIRFFGFA